MKLPLVCAAAAWMCCQGAPVSAEPNSANRFAWDSLVRLCSQQRSVVYSPYSLRAAIGLLQFGAGGDTSAVLAEVVGPADEGEHGAGLRKLEPAVTFRSTNALFVASDLPLHKSYVTGVEQQFGARVANVDFASPRTLPQINTWAEQQTRGKIRNLLTPAQVDRQTRAVLLNAVYLKASWKHRFDKKRTRPGSFFDGTTDRSVPMMHLNGSFLYAEAADFAVLELPYAGDRLADDCILPNERDGLAAVRSNLKWAQLDSVLRQLARTEVALSTPRLKIESSHQLLPLLQAMGFPVSGDYSGISDEKLVVSEVAQKAFLELDEQGTEAAAATAVVTTRSIPQRLEFRVDRPFMYLVRDTRTRAILFAGQVYTPQ